MCHTCLDHIIHSVGEHIRATTSCSFNDFIIRMHNSCLAIGQMKTPVKQYQKAEHPGKVSVRMCTSVYIYIYLWVHICMYVHKNT